MNAHIAGYARDALDSLTPSQIKFLQQLPKAELHAHLNGSIPLPALRSLAQHYLRQEQPSTSALSNESVRAGIERLLQGVVFKEIHEFFDLFPAVYALTSTPAALSQATRAVLDHFLSDADGYPQASYFELRTTPRETPAMSSFQYLETVLNEVERWPESRAALIVSLDRRMSRDVALQCVNAAVRLQQAGRRVVGVDLCGDIKAGDMVEFAEPFRIAKDAGLGITLHIAETDEAPATEIHQLLSYKPDRLGHATFLDDAAKEVVKREKICIEICLSSNLLCKTVKHLDVHHIRYFLEHEHPIVICTDDIMPFRNSLLGEYAMLLAKAPHGLGLTESEVENVARLGLGCKFGARQQN